MLTIKIVLLKKKAQMLTVEKFGKLSIVKVQKDLSVNRLMNNLRMLINKISKSHSNADS